MSRRRPILALVTLGLAAFAVACASPPPQAAGSAARAPRVAKPSAPSTSVGSRVAQVASAQIGTPYRYGGSTPRGFDCSGLVVYSYTEAGRPGLPHSAQALDRLARSVALEKLRPGDLLFFELTGKKTSHVGIYVGDRSFVHSPSSGKRVERVSFGHVYWRDKIRRAGRIY